MKQFFFLITILCHVSLPALTLKDKISKGCVGDFIVTEQNNLYTILRIDAIDSKMVSIEEISFPKQEKPIDWSSWIQNGAKGHTCWNLIEIDLEKASVCKCFSFTKQAILIPNKEQSFLLTLLKEPLLPIPEEDRKKIGPPPKEGIDKRKIWTPPIIMAGEKKKAPQCIAYQITCPKNDSFLSGKRIELFFNKDYPQFPFPYWGQITDASNAAIKLRVVDSGHNLPSPRK